MIKVRGLKKTFKTTKNKKSWGGDVVALDDVNFDIAEGEFFVLLGPSGSGKTTLLRSIAGLETPDEGEIHIGDRLVFSSSQGVCVPPMDRRLGMVFQSYAIWPHMTVFENVALPLQEGKRRFPKAEVKDKVARALALVGLQGLEDRPAPLLSGGQQQRVALARAMAVEPVVLLMDEPLSNLDARLREEVRGEIRSLTNRLGVTVIYVTHDQTEAMELADRLAVVSEGSILQIAPPEEVYSFPNQPEVAQFFGKVNWLEGAVQKGGAIKTPLGILISGDTKNFAEGDKVAVGIRPENLRIFPECEGVPNGRMVFPCTIKTTAFLGAYSVYAINVGDCNLVAMRTGSENLEGPGFLRVPEPSVRLFPGAAPGEMKD